MKSAIEGFASGITGFTLLSPREQNEWITYYFTEITGDSFVTATKIDKARGDLSLEAYRSAADLSERSKKKKGKVPVFFKLAKGYKLHRATVEKLAAQLNIGRSHSAQRTSSILHATLAKLSGHPREPYLAEAVGCFEAKFYRAARALSALR